MSTAAGKPFILVDGTSYFYRAFHALPPLTNSQGEPTGAVYGVANMLRRLLKDYAPEYMAVIFDAPGKTFRDDLFAAYKAQRPPMPDDLRAQIEPLHALVRALGIPLLQVDGVEADDVIATLASKAAAQQLFTLISTSDKDMAQLVGAYVHLINTMNNTVLDVDGVRMKFGVGPERIVDYLALVGDTSDNIPGVPMVGPKTAAKWLHDYGSLDAIMAKASEIPGKAGESLRSCLGVLPLARELASLRCDMELGHEPLDLKLSPPDQAVLNALLKRLEFTAWLHAAADPAPAHAAAVQAPNVSSAASLDWHVITSLSELDTWIARLRDAPLVAFDTETTSVEFMRARLVGLSFAIAPGSAAYVPVDHDYPGAPEQLNRDEVLQRLRPLLTDPMLPKLGHNLKYDYGVLANYGIELTGIAHDSMLQSYVLDSTATRHDMDTLALKHLSHKTISYADVAGKGAKQLRFNEVPVEQAAPYAAEDAEVTLRLHHAFWPRLNSEPALARLYADIEIPLVPVLARLERNGVLVDRAMLQRQSAELALRILETEQAAHSEAGQPFNLGSPKQIQEILFDKLQLPSARKTPTGQPSTAEDALTDLAADYALPRLILEHRALCKLRSTYTERLPEQINPHTGRVHTCYHQAVAATGRLSSSDPNLQNIPVRTAEGRRIRQAFVAPAGYKLLAADYSQIELRIMAHLSGDNALLRAFAAGDDIHSATAAEVFGSTSSLLMAEQRRAAKTINFGLIYVMYAFGLARALGIDRQSAQDYINRYFTRYPGVKQFMDRTRAEAHKTCYVETLFGRRLHLPEINVRNAQRRQYAERTAINAPMQGTAADIIKLAMLNVDAWVRDSGANVKMIMQVHDELVFEVAEDDIDSATQQIRACMLNTVELAIPLVVDIGSGDNWDEAH